MKNIERAKNYQKKLYTVLGKQWNESFFSDYWEATLTGHEWDNLYDKGYLENDFCAWCGNDELKTYYYREPNFSARRVKVFICDDCFFKATGGNVPYHQMAKSTRSGCFIATAVYGYDSHPSVMLLREYRDNVLMKNFLGKMFINFYYLISPPIAKILSNNRALSVFIKRTILEPIIGLIKGKNIY